VIQTQVCIRTATEADAGAVRAFLAGLSPDTQYQRFFTGLGSVSPSLVRELVTVTPRQRVLLAVTGTEVVGHAMASTNAAGAVELGVVVAAGYRHRGLGTRLIRGLLEHVIDAGADRLQMDVLGENELVLEWIRRSLPETLFEPDGYTVTGHAPLTRAMIEVPVAV
jgi:GNAT superfamily N-acetyltransferase